MKHFGIFDTVEDAQDALNAGRLENDYVALVDGDLDYNSMSPERPCVIGEWSDDGQGHYTFQILNTGDTAWMNTISIAQLFGLYPNGDGPYDVDLRLTLNLGEPNIWNMEFHVDDQSDMPLHEFYDGSQELWNSGAMVDPNESNSSVDVNWDGADTFTFSAADLNINTINPECPPSE
jgi:hypothetical protein